MKKVLKVIWGFFAVIGILLTLRLIPVFCGNQSISIYRSTKGHYSDYVELLRTSGAFGNIATDYPIYTEHSHIFSATSQFHACNPPLFQDQG